MNEKIDYTLEIKGIEYVLQIPVFNLIKEVSLERDDLRREKEIYNSLSVKTDRNAEVVAYFKTELK